MTNQIGILLGYCLIRLLIGLSAFKHNILVHEFGKTLTYNANTDYTEPVTFGFLTVNSF